MDHDFFIIRKMKQGDEEAMESFVRNYYPPVLRYCRYHVSDWGYAEDLAQETFERFFRALPGYQNRGKTINYLYVIAGNLCRDHYKKKIDMPVQELPETEDYFMDRIFDKLDMEAALGELPDELRDVIILYYFQELKLKEIGKIQNIGLPLVKYRMRKAKEMLGRILGKEETL